MGCPSDLERPSGCLMIISLWSISWFAYHWRHFCARMRTSDAVTSSCISFLSFLHRPWDYQCYSVNLFLKWMVNKLQTSSSAMLKLCWWYSTKPSVLVAGGASFSFIIFKSRRDVSITQQITLLFYLVHCCHQPLDTEISYGDMSCYWSVYRGAEREKHNKSMVEFYTDGGVQHLLAWDPPSPHCPCFPWR